MGLREARRDEVKLIVGMMLDDELGSTREDASDLTPYLEGFDAIAADPLDTQYVWEESGKVVGCLQLTLLPGIAQQGMWRAQIEGVRIARAQRGTGIGGKMIQAVMTVARERGCALMQLTTNKIRRDAQRFYEQLGFEKSHEGMKIKL